MWTLINLLLTLDKRYIVKQGTLDYFCLPGHLRCFVNNIIFLLHLHKCIVLIYYNYLLINDRIVNILALSIVSLQLTVSNIFSLDFKVCFHILQSTLRCHLCKESNIQEDLQHLFFKCVISNRFISNITILINTLNVGTVNLNEKNMMFGIDFLFNIVCIILIFTSFVLIILPLISVSFKLFNNFILFLLLVLFSLSEPIQWKMSPL
jgi:hypothetical protein